MTVQELMDQLENFDPNMKIMLWGRMPDDDSLDESVKKVFEYAGKCCITENWNKNVSSPRQ